jgi:hypothetical protein
VIEAACARGSVVIGFQELWQSLNSDVETMNQMFTHAATLSDGYEEEKFHKIRRIMPV